MSLPSRMRPWIVGCLAALALAPVASAQDASVQQETDRLRKGGQTLDALREAGDEARDLALLDDAGIGYADVLANPDDVATSLRWARHQVREGQLRGAAATLERVLLLEPALVPVRLLYAVVLYRLDDLAEAGRELDRISEGPMSAAERAEVDRYRRLVRRAARRTRYDASLTFGTQYETNRNTAPSSGTSLVQLGDTRLELDLTSDSREQDDVAIFGLTQVGFEHDLGFHEGHTLRGSFSVYLAGQDQLDEYDTRAYAAELGGRYRAGWGDLTSLLFGGLVELSSETFLKNVGIDLRLERRDGPRRSLRGGFRIEWQDFDSVSQSVTSNEHTGTRFEAGVGATFRPNPVHQLDADLRWIVKDARGSATPGTSDVYSHDGPDLSARHTWLLGGGTFLLSEIGVARDSYWRPDRRITSKRSRRDLRVRASLAFGVPLQTLLATLLPEATIPSVLSGVVMSIGVNHQLVESNIPNYEYDDTKTSLTFTRQWSF